MLRVPAIHEAEKQWYESAPIMKIKCLLKFHFFLRLPLWKKIPYNSTLKDVHVDESIRRADGRTQAARWTDTGGQMDGHRWADGQTDVQTVDVGGNEIKSSRHVI